MVCVKVPAGGQFDLAMIWKVALKAKLFWPNATTVHGSKQLAVPPILDLFLNLSQICVDFHKIRSLPSLTKLIVNIPILKGLSN